MTPRGGIYGDLHGDGRPVETHLTFLDFWPDDKAVEAIRTFLSHLDQMPDNATTLLFMLDRASFKVVRKFT